MKFRKLVNEITDSSDLEKNIENFEANTKEQQKIVDNIKFQMEQLNKDKIQKQIEEKKKAELEKKQKIEQMRQATLNAAKASSQQKQATGSVNLKEIK